MSATSTAVKRERPGDVIVRRLSALCELTDAETELVLKSAARQHTHPPGQFLQHEEEEPTAPKYIVSGWACRQHAMEDGRRQIYTFLLPGDPVGLHRSASTVARTSILALTDVRTVDAREIDAASAPGGDYPGLHCAVERAAQESTAFLLNQIVRIGRLTAYERIAHLVMELHYRLSMVGHANSQTIPCPLTQDVLADTLGLSTVHINRTLKQLRREGVMEIRSGKIRIQREDMLESISGFEPPKTFFEFRR